MLKQHKDGDVESSNQHNDDDDKSKDDRSVRSNNESEGSDNDDKSSESDGNRMPPSRFSALAKLQKEDRKEKYREARRDNHAMSAWHWVLDEVFAEKFASIRKELQRWHGSIGDSV